MKKVLILSNYSSGLYEFRNELIQDFLKDSEVYISLPEGQDDRYVRLFKEEGCNVIHTPFERRGMNPLKDYDLFRSYKKIIKDISPDIVLTYTIKPNIYGGLAAKSLGIPYITNITGLGTAILGGGPLAKVLLVLYKKATAGACCIFFQNSSNKDYMTKHGIRGNGDIKLIPGSGVNLKRHSLCEYPDESKGIELLSVMRIMKDKGIEELLEVADRLGTPSDDSRGAGSVHFVIAGPYEEETRSLYEPKIQKLETEGKLTYLGFVNDMDPVYEHCNVMVHPSYHEGLSNVCLEAAACGRPIVTTDVPGCRETVNERSGILCQPRSTQSLYEAISSILALTPEERKEMGVAGRTHVEETFDRNIVIDSYREYI